MIKRRFDVGIVVPLKEELRYVLEIAQQLESISHEGTYFYRLDFGRIEAVCCLVGQMGPIPALQAASRLLGFADVKLLVVLGLGGALDNDINIGDVVIATEVNEFQANSKAESSGAGYEVRYSGRHWPLEYRIREALNNFEFSGRHFFNAWQADASTDYSQITLVDKEKVCTSQPIMHLGPIASGNVVAASNAFVSEIKRIDRKFLAIDMEAGGVAPAAAERIHPLPCLVVRGISDPANESKKALDEQGKGVWRRYCVRNATSFLRQLLRWEGFLMAAGLISSNAPEESRHRAAEIALRLQSCLGGPWIVGVAFGVYSHGLRMEAGKSAIPMDLSRLRVLDGKVDKVLDEANEKKEKFLADGDLDMAVEGFRKVVEGYLNNSGMADAASLLEDFDRVVLEILCPKSDGEEVESLLLESERLEGEVGAEAVIELLRDLATTNPRLRERYIDALVSAGQWPTVVEVIGSVQPSQLSRRELEHAIFAYLKMNQPDLVRQLIAHHQKEYADNAGKLFRKAVSRQHSDMANGFSGESR